LSHRAEARRIAFATARVQDGTLVESGWAGLADPQTTVVVYMAREAAGAVAARLMAEGRSGATPALAVENAGRPQARAVSARLADLGEAVAGAGFEGPVALVVGETTAQARGAEAFGDVERQASRA